ncbi:transposon ty3-G gag-pol polyprotein [Tanacetum coccineum]
MAPSTRMVTANNSNGDKGITREYLDAQYAKMRNLLATLGLKQNQAMNQGRQANQFGRLVKVEFPKFQKDDVSALLWNRQYLSVNGENMSWEVYKNAIIQIFGSIFKDQMSALKNAKYEKNAKEYQDLFDTLLCRVTISQEHAINAYSLTRLQEAILDVLKKKNKPSGSFNSNMFSNRGNYGNVSKPTILPKPNTPVNTPVRKQLTQKEYQEKRAQNLCFYCDQKYTLGYKCAWPTRPLAVILAGGNNLVTTSECKNFQWKFDTTIFTIDVMLLPLGGCEMLRGTHQSNVVWLNNKKSVKTTRQVVQGEFHSMALSVYPMNTISCSNLEGMLVAVDEKIQTVFKNYEDVFGISVNLPPQRTHDHKIPLVERALPVNIRPYTHPPNQKDAIEAMVKELLEAGVIKKSHSPFASYIVMFPIPIIEELIDELHGAKLFTKLDLRSVYHQIRMNEADVAKTAFRTREGHYEFLVMPFGLANAPSTFQSLMNECLEEHVKHLQTILETMRTYKLFAKLSKCVFGTTQVEYLGNVISAQGVAIDPAKIEAMANWLVPTSLKGYEWNSAAQSAFEALKQDMISALVLKLADFTKEFTIEIDDLGGGIGEVLLQKGHLIAFLSKTLSTKHQLMSTYEKEFLAVVVALEKWKGYLLDRHFKIKTDHINLKYLLDQRMSTPTQLKLLPNLIGFDFTIVYKKGVDNVTADALSRMQNPAGLLSLIGRTSVTTVLRKGKLMVGNDEVLRKKLLQQVYRGGSGGHSGVKVTTHKLCSMFYRKKIRKEVKQFVRNCEVCQRYKPNLEAYLGLVQPLPIPTSIWTSISMDFIEGLPKSQGKDVILVVVDKLSKYSYFMALSHPFTASQVAQLFLDNIYKLHRLPMNIMSDRDKIFFDGQTEVVNRCLKCYLRCMTGEQPKKPPPVNIPYIGGESKIDLVDKTLREREAAVEALKFHISRAQSRMKSHADKGRTDKQFDFGD